MAAMPDHLRIRLTFRPNPRLSLRLKIAAIIIRFGCWIGGGDAGSIEIGP